jgi:hypothetical protein
MILRLTFVFLFACLGLAQQTPTIQQYRLSQADFIKWAYKVQLNSPKNSPGYHSKGQLFLIAPSPTSAVMGELVDRLAHGFTDCTGTFLCINAPVYPAQNLQVFTGAALEAHYWALTQNKYVGFPWGWAYTEGQLYVGASVPKAGLWLWETGNLDYIITGSLLDGTGTEVQVVEGPGIAAAMREAMMVGRILQGSRKAGGGGYNGKVEKLFDEIPYTDLGALAGRIASEQNIIVVGTIQKSLVEALNARAGWFGIPITVIAGSDAVGSFGPCTFWGIIRRPVRYAVLDSKPQGGFVILERGLESEIITGSMISPLDKSATKGMKGAYVQRILKQFDLPRLLSVAKDMCPK